MVSGWGEWGMMTDLLDRGISVRGRISGGDGGRLVICWMVGFVITGDDAGSASWLIAWLYLVVDYEIMLWFIWSWISIGRVIYSAPDWAAWHLVCVCRSADLTGGIHTCLLVSSKDGHIVKIK